MNKQHKIIWILKIKSTVQLCKSCMPFFIVNQSILLSAKERDISDFLKASFFLCIYQCAEFLRGMYFWNMYKC